MNINVVCIGKLKEKYWRDAVDEYIKRISRFAKVEIIELRESRLPENASPADEETVKYQEGEEILKRIKPGDFCITLEIMGKQLDSVELAEQIKKIWIRGSSTIDFVIGCSLGLSDDVSRRADFRLSFSKMTFPHQMARMILSEQIYRAFEISSNGKYHK